MPVRVLLFAIFLFLGFVNLTYAQEAVIKGRIVESTEGSGISSAVVLVLLGDSIIEKFTRTGKDGRFELAQIPAGQYLVLFTHPKFTDYSQFVTVGAQNICDLGKITLARKADSLPPVTVTPRSPVPHLKGDTLEYSTAGVKMKPNATVEELLSRLPGVQVNPDGTILVNGKKVDKLLVDGEDIFGTDPKNVTRNFNGDLFSKVQVLDKKSDRAAITGIEDGKTTHTLNLVMKEDKKKGNFGKVEVGAGTGSYYNNTGLLGSFLGSQQFVGIGLASNTGTKSFSGSGEGREVASIAVSSEIDDGLAASAGAGVPHATGGGVHYSNKWDNKGEHLSGNYSYGHTLAYPFMSSVTQQLLADTIYLQSQNSHSANAADEHSFSGLYDVNPDTLSSLHFALNGLSVSSDNQFNNSASTYLNNTLVNQSDRRVSSKVMNRSISGSVYGSRKLGKKGDLLSFTADLGTTQNNSSGYVYSVNQYFHIPGTTNITDQKKELKVSGLSAEGSINFSKALNQTIALSFSYNISNHLGKTRLDTYNRGDGKYTDKVDSLSTNFEPAIFSQKGGVNFTWKNQRVSLIAAAAIMHYRITEHSLFAGSQVPNSYQFISPHVFGHYKFDDAHIVYFSYAVSPQLPNFAQLQPLQNNTDPLHIVVGNPQLKPTISHNFGVRLFRAMPASVDLGLQASFLENDITSQTYTDSLGRQVTQAVNINGNKNVSSYVFFNKNVLPAALNAELGFVSSYSRSSNFVNIILSQNDIYNLASRVTLGKTVLNKYTIQARSEVNYALTHSSINSAQTHYWTQNHSLLIDLRLPAGLEWNTSCTLIMLQKTPAFRAKNRLVILESYVNKDFFSSTLSAKLRASDLLAEQTSIGRGMTGNQITESNSNNVTGRYFLFSITYHFPQKKEQ